MKCQILFSRRIDTESTLFQRCIVNTLNRRCFNGVFLLENAFQRSAETNSGDANYICSIETPPLSSVAVSDINTRIQNTLQYKQKGTLNNVSDH